MADEEAQLLLDRVLERVEVGQRGGRRGLGAQHLAVGPVAAAVEGELHGGPEVVVAAVRPLAHLAVDVGLHAADHAVVCEVVLGDALAPHHRDGRVHAVQGGEAGAEAYELADVTQEVGRRAVVDECRQRRLVQAYVHRSLHDEVRKFVGGVGAVGVRTAGAEVLERHVAGEVLGRVLVEDPGHAGHLDPEALEQFLRAVARQATGGEVRLVERMQVVVHAPGRVRGAVLLEQQHDLCEPDELQGLAEGTRGVGADPAAGLGDLQQLVGALRRGTGGQPLGLTGVPAGQHVRRLAHHHDRLQEAQLVVVVGVGRVQFGDACLGGGGDAAETLLQEDVAVTGAELAGAVLRLELDVDDARVHGDAPCAFGQVGEVVLLHGAAAPVGKDLVAQYALVLVADVVGVLLAGGDRVELGLEPAPRDLRADDGAARLEGRHADDQLIGEDGDRLLGADALECGGPADARGEALRLPVAARVRERALDADRRAEREIVLAQPRHPVAARTRLALGLRRHHRHDRHLSVRAGGGAGATLRRPAPLRSAGGVLVTR